MMRWKIRSLKSALAICAVAAGSFGQELPRDASPRPTPQNADPGKFFKTRPKDGGTQDIVYVRIPAADFTPNYSGDGYSAVDGNRWLLTTGSMVAGVKLPGGVILTYLELDYCDTSIGSHLTGNIYECNNVGTGCHYLMASNLISNGNGCNDVSADLTGLGYTVDNYDRIMTAVVGSFSGDGTTQLVSMIIGYNLQVSPAPVTQTFGDVPPGDPGFRYIEALVSSGITAGCGGGNYCPDSTLTRRQMAVFLAKALGLHWP